MQTYTLKVTSLHDPTCIRTLEMTAEQTLEMLASAIQQEFALWDSDRRVFFMSGELGDWGTAFDCAQKAGAVALGELELAPGMEIASLHDNRFPHSVEVTASGEAPAGASYPRVIARQGEPLPAEMLAQLGGMFDEHECDGGDECGCGCGEEGEQEESCGCGCGGEEAGQEESCGCGCGGEEAGQEQSCGCGGGCEEQGCEGCAEGENDGCGEGCSCCGDGEDEHPEDCECDECVAKAEARKSFDPELLAKVEKALDHTMLEEELDTALLQRALEAIALACADREALERLSIATDTPIDEWGSAMLAVLQDERGAKQLVELAARWAKMTGEFEDAVLHAEVVARAGDLPAALKLLAGFKVNDSREEDWRQLMTARLQVLGGKLAEGEPVLRSLLDRRWLPGQMRELAVGVLSEGLRAAGREREVEMLQRSEQARLKKLDALRGPVEAD